MDKISIKNLKIFGNHGVYDEERRNGQEFIFDVEVNLDMSDAALSDDVNFTVDYTEIVKLIQEINEKNVFFLMEKLVFAIAEEILERFEKVVSTKVRVRKKCVLKDAQFDYVEFETERSR